MCSLFSVLADKGSLQIRVKYISASTIIRKDIFEDQFVDQIHYNRPLDIFVSRTNIFSIEGLSWTSNCHNPIHNNLVIRWYFRNPLWHILEQQCFQILKELDTVYNKIREIYLQTRHPSWFPELLHQAFQIGHQPTHTSVDTTSHISNQWYQ